MPATAAASSPWMVGVVVMAGLVGASTYLDNRRQSEAEAEKEEPEQQPEPSPCCVACVRGEIGSSVSGVACKKKNETEGVACHCFSDESLSKPVVVGYCA